MNELTFALQYPIFFAVFAEGLLMHRSIALVFGAALILAGCQTPYQDMGAMGGVSAMPIATNTYRIVARGNGYTDGIAIQDYALLKAAEVTLQSGNTHFVIAGANDASRNESFTTAGSMQTTFIGSTAFTTFNPGYTMNYVKPGQDLIIHTGTIAPGQASPPGAMNAREVFDAINPRVVRPNQKRAAPPTPVAQGAFPPAPAALTR